MNYRELTFLYFAFWFWQYQVNEDDWYPDQDEKCAAEQLEAMSRGLA